MHYFIEHESGHIGPLDLLGVIRKIRNGSLDKHDMLLRADEEQAKHAYQHPELYEIFLEQDRLEQEFASSDIMNDISFVTLMKSGFQILKEDQAPLMVCGMFLIISTLIAASAAFGLPPMIGGLIAPPLCYVLFALTQIAILRIARIQLYSPSYFGQVLKQHGAGLLFSILPPALIGFSLPWMLSGIVGPAAWGLALLAGLPLMAYFFYVPILIVDRELSFKAALKLNHMIITSLGLSIFSLMMGLLFINVIAASLVVTLLVTLPISLLGLIQLYDRHFNEF